MNAIKEIDERGSHNHVLSDNDINKAKTSHKIKELAESTKYSTSKVYSMATNSANIFDLPIFPKKSMYKNIQNSRKRNSIDVNYELNLRELNIKSLRNENLVLYDSGSNDVNRIIIFSTEKNEPFE